MASFPGSPFWILSRSFGEKIRNGEPGNEATMHIKLEQGGSSRGAFGMSLTGDK